MYLTKQKCISLQWSDCELFTVNCTTLSLCFTYATFCFTVTHSFIHQCYYQLYTWMFWFQWRVRVYHCWLWVWLLLCTRMHWGRPTGLPTLLYGQGSSYRYLTLSTIYYNPFSLCPVFCDSQIFTIPKLNGHKWTTIFNHLMAQLSKAKAHTIISIFNMLIQS